MATQLARANQDGTLNPSGAFARAVVLVNVSDIIASAGISNAEKRAQALTRLLAELSLGIANDAKADAAIDAEAAAASAAAATDATLRKAAKPAGTL